MDHEKLRINPTAISCGVGQLSAITDASDKDILFAIGTSLYHPSRGAPYAFFLYSSTDKDPRSASLFRAIAEQRLGMISYSDYELNPQTGNMIRVVIWAIDHVTYRAWWVKERIARYKKMV